MLVIPAVDIRGGKAVRLKQGKADQQTVYDDDPVHAARRWAEAGARRIHIVDLDGAFEGTPKNRPLVLAILKTLLRPGPQAIEFQIGGGLRAAGIIDEYLAAGSARCVIGTQALENQEFLRGVAARNPGRINVGIDARNGKVVTKGWVSESQTTAAELVRALATLPLGEIIYTDIERDGMLEGPNLKQLEEMRKASPFPLIASGGVTTVDNIRRCREMGCFGAIIGKAFYDGRLGIGEALNAAAEPVNP